MCVRASTYIWLLRLCFAASVVTLTPRLEMRRRSSRQLPLTEQGFPFEPESRPSQIVSTQLPDTPDTVHFGVDDGKLKVAGKLKF